MVKDLLQERFSVIVQEDTTRRTRELQEFVQELMEVLEGLEARIAALEAKHP